MTSDTRCRIAPEPIEAPEPQPVAPLSQVEIDALHEGWRAMTGEGPGLSSFSSFKVGVLARDAHLAERRRMESQRGPLFEAGVTMDSAGKRLSTALGHIADGT